MVDEFSTSKITENATTEASISEASASTSTTPAPAVCGTNYARNTPSVFSRRKEHTEKMDLNDRFKSHADIAFRLTIGPIPMQEFLGDARLCPPSPQQDMPDVLDDTFKDLVDTPDEDDMQRVIVSCPCFMTKHTP